MNPELSREQLQEVWRKRLKEAKSKLKLAMHQVQELKEDCLAGNLPAPDGGFAYRRALREEGRRREEYLRILRLVHDLVAYGKIPEEDPESHGFAQVTLSVGSSPEFKAQKPGLSGLRGAASVLTTSSTAEGRVFRTHATDPQPVRRIDERRRENARPGGKRSYS